MVLYNERIDPFTGATNYASISGETHTADADGFVWLDEIPSSSHPISIVQPGAVSSYFSPENTYVYEGTPYTNNQYSPELRTGRESGDPYYMNAMYIAVSTGTIPASLANGKMKLYLNDTTGTGGFPSPRTIRVSRVLGPWTQASIIWRHQPSSDGIPWAQVVVTNAGWYEFDLTPLLQSFKNGTYPNYGVVAFDLYYAGDTRRSFTSQHGALSRRPFWQYTEPSTSISTVVPYPPSPGSSISVNYERGVVATGMPGATLSFDYTGKGTNICAQTLIGALG